MLSRSRTILLRRTFPSISYPWIFVPINSYPWIFVPINSYPWIVYSFSSFSTSIDRTTLPVDQPGTSGIEGPTRKPPSSTSEPGRKESPTKDRDDLEQPQYGEEAIPPPFNPSDPEGKKRLREQQWEEAPPKEREPSEQLPSEVIRLSDGSFSVEFMDRLRRCTSPHKIERDGTIKYEMIRLLNLKKFGVPIVSRLLVDHKDGMDGALRFLSNSFQMNIRTFSDCCSDELSKRLSLILTELNGANARLMIVIDEAISAQIFNVDVITPEGVRHDTLKGDFPFLQLFHTLPSIEFEGTLEVNQKIYIEDKGTGKVLYGSKDSMTAYHKMKFTSDLTPILPGFPRSLSEVIPFCNKTAALSVKEMLSAVRNPFRASPWVLLDIANVSETKST